MTQATRRPTCAPAPSSRAGAAVAHHAGHPLPIVAASLREATPPQRTAALRRLLTAIIETAGGPVALLLPGVCAGWPLDESAVAQLAEEHNATVLFECVTAGWRVAAADGSVLPWAAWQSFGSSKEADRDPGRVQKLVEAGEPGGERRLLLGGHDVGLLACGENNVLRNAQSRGNAVSVRHGAAGRLFPGATVVFNGAHTEMGNWPKLQRRFEWLSADPPGDEPRLALFATNNTRGSWGGVLRAWWGGKRLATGVGVDVDGVGRGVQLVIEPGDEARAILIERDASSP